MENYREPTLTKVSDGYLLTYVDPFYLCFKYDNDGNYVGQYQEDMIGGYGELFFPATVINGIPCVEGKPMKPHKYYHKIHINFCKLHVTLKHNM